jgi:hypothetical protein
MAQYIKLQGFVVGNLTSAGWAFDEKYKKNRFKVVGRWNVPGDTISCADHISDMLVEAGAIGYHEDGACWVNGDIPVFIAKEGSGVGNVKWHAGVATGQEPAPIVQGGPPQGGQGYRPPQAAAPQGSYRPAQAPQAAPQRSAAPQGSYRPAQAPQAAPQRSAAPQQAYQAPREDAEVTKRRIEAEMAECLLAAARIWKSADMKSTGIEPSPEAVQATAATLVIRRDKLGLPLALDPQAPPKPTPAQLAELKELKEAAHRLQQTDQWFYGEAAKYGPVDLAKGTLTKGFSTDHAAAAIKGISGALSAIEAKLRAEEVARAGVGQVQPQAPVGGGDPDEEIPF